MTDMPYTAGTDATSYVTRNDDDDSESYDDSDYDDADSSDYDSEGDMKTVMATAVTMILKVITKIVMIMTTAVTISSMMMTKSLLSAFDDDDGVFDDLF